MRNDTRHEQLMQAGWIYDSTTDRYREKGSPDDGTARLYDIDAAFLQWSIEQGSDAAPRVQPAPRPLRQVDPRKQEPE